MMFVLPAMLLKGLHWGYTKFWLNRFAQPLNYTEDEKLRRFHPDEDDSLLSKTSAVNLKGLDTDKGKEDEAACPVAPVLRLFGLHKTKPPGHPPEAKEDLLREVSKSTTTKMQ